MHSRYENTISVKRILFSIILFHLYSDLLNLRKVLLQDFKHLLVPIEVLSWHFYHIIASIVLKRLHNGDLSVRHK